MLDKMTRLASEQLARALDRRAFLQRLGSGAFLLLAALASGQGLASRPAAARGRLEVAGPRPTPAPPPPGRVTTPCCAPPGPYCNLDGVNEPNGCQGANCFAHLYNGQVFACSLYYGYYASGCWTTNCQSGYYTCCDCLCSDGQGQPVTSCGCAQFSANPWHGTD